MMAGVLDPAHDPDEHAPLRTAGYTLLQITNPVWTLFECCAKGIPIVGPAVAARIVAGGHPGVRWPTCRAWPRKFAGAIAKPPRVAEEDAQLALAAAGGPQPSSPWDEP